MNPNMKATKITKTRRYRITKRIARRPRAILKFDKGNVEQQITLVFPEPSIQQNVEIPKTPNPDLLSVNIGSLRLCYYYKDKKGFFYDCDGIYCGSLEKHDLKHAFSRIGDILKTVKRQKG